MFYTYDESCRNGFSREPQIFGVKTPPTNFTLVTCNFPLNRAKARPTRERAKQVSRLQGKTR